MANPRCPPLEANGQDILFVEYAHIDRPILRFARPIGDQAVVAPRNPANDSGPLQTHVDRQKGGCQTPSAMHRKAKSEIHMRLVVEAPVSGVA